MPHSPPSSPSYLSVVSALKDWFHLLLLFSSSSPMCSLHIESSCWTLLWLFNVPLSFPIPLLDLPFYSTVFFFFHSNDVYIHDLQNSPVPENLHIIFFKSVYSFSKCYSPSSISHCTERQGDKQAHNDRYFKSVSSMWQMWTSCYGRKKP